MGSQSDLPTMNGAAEILKQYDIPHRVVIVSAHRSPDDAARFAKRSRSQGVKVIIAGAGGAAHLAGVIASHTTLPVIGVPMETKELLGIDSLLAIVQMPSGVPVATVTIGATGAKNAAILALQILALSDAKIEQRLRDHKKTMARSVRNAARAVAGKKRS